MSRVYIAGPMTGYPELNFPAFHQAAAEWRAKGWHVENPAEINPDPGAVWADCMRADVARLVTCDAVYLLPGWKKSRGAKLEAHIGREMGLELIEAPLPSLMLNAKQTMALHLVRAEKAATGKTPSFKALGIDMGISREHARALVVQLQRLSLVEPHKLRAPRGKAVSA